MRFTVTVPKKVFLLSHILICFIFCTENVNGQQPVISSFSPDSGALNTAVTIKGQNLNGATAVSFGGTPAYSFFNIDSTMIRAYVGQGSSGTVSVTTPGGTAALPGFTFLPAPIITSFDPVQGYAGTTVTIKGTGFNGTLAVGFGNTGAASFAVLSDTVITAVVGTGSTGDVSIGGSHGSAALGGFSFIGPQIFSFNPTSGSDGTVVTITGTNFTGATAVSFGGVLAKSFSVVSASVITAVVASGASGDVTVTTNYGTATMPAFNKPYIISFSPTYGGPGTIVTIKGYNFTSTTQVKFGDSAAKRFTVLSDTVIQAVLGYGTSGNVMVKTLNDSAAKSYFFFFYPLPTISSFSPTTGKFNTPVTITGHHFIGVTAVVFGGVNAQSFTILSDSVIIAVPGVGAAGNILVVSGGGGVATASGFQYISVPVITGFNPASGPAGTNLVITGGFFNKNADSNYVFFGPVKARVIQADTQRLVVEVPYGAGYQPITVAAHGYIASSPGSFHPSFAGGLPSFSDSSFEARIDIHNTGTAPEYLAAGDFDGDGKADLVVSDGLFSKKQSIAVYKNVCTDSKIAFGAPLELFISTDTIDNPLPVTVADVNADGKLDLVVTNYWQNTVSVLRNIGTGGQIQFDTKKDFTVDTSYAALDQEKPNSGTVADFDGDGKPDLAFAHYSGYGMPGRISILRNLSTGNQMLFGDRQYYDVRYPRRIQVGDFNNDNRLDIAVAVNAYAATVDDKQVYVFANASEPGKILFKPSGNYGDRVSANSLVLADLDGDKKEDITVMNNDTRSVSIFRNITTAFNTSFEPAINDTLNYSSRYAAANDLDGDGKTDLAVSNGMGIGMNNKVSLLKNKSDIGAIKFNNKQDYITGNGSDGVLLVDLDNDGRPDMVTTNNEDSSISIFRNRIGEAKIVPSGNSPVTGSISKKVIVDSAVANYNGNVFVQRHYDVEPQNNPSTSTATLTLYFTQKEFDNYNSYANHGKDLPKNPTDTSGIANMRIYQYHGSSLIGNPGSYSGGAVEINPADSNVKWNVDAECWEVSFDMKGFSGFFTGTTLNNSNPLPDIIVTNSSTNQASTGTGGTVTVSFTIVNKGQANAPAHQAYFYLSADTILTTGTNADILLDSSDVNAVNVNASSGSLMKGLSIPCSVTPGNYYLLIVADGGNTVYESNENNNVAYIPVTITAGVMVQNPPLITATPGSTACSPDVVTLTVASSNCSSCIYTWNNGEADTVITVTNSGIYTVTVSNACGTATATQTVTINAPPVITLSTTSTSICAGESVTLTASGAVDYSWSGPNLNSTTGNSVTASPATPGSYTFNATGTTNGCSQTEAVVVSVTSAPTVTIAQKDTSICEGSSIILSSSASTSNQWFRNNTLISGATSQTYVVSQAGSYKVAVSNGTCNATSEEVTVTFNPVPPTPVVTAGGSVTFCEGGNVVLSSSSASGNQWYRDGIEINGATTENYTANLSGNYTVKTTGAGCTSNSSTGIAVTVNGVPATPVINQAGSTLTSSSNSGNQWYKNGVVITGATAASYTPLETGDYSVSVTLNGCTSAQSSSISYVVTAVSSPLLDKSIQIFPSPVHERLTIKYNGRPSVFTISLIDLYGRSLIQKQFVSSTELYLTGLTAGTYLLHVVNTRSNEHVQRLIIKF